MSSVVDSRIMILATDGFEQSELEVPLKSLRDMGATVHVVSLEEGEITGWDKKDWGNAVPVDKVLADVAVSDYDALILPGGQINPDVLRVEKSALSFIHAFHDTGKPIAAICHAPWLLIETGIVRGRHATSYHSIRTDMENAGALWEDSETVRDGNIITARKPDDLEAFVRAVVDVIEEGSASRTAAQ